MAPEINQCLVQAAGKIAVYRTSSIFVVLVKGRGRWQSVPYWCPNHEHLGQ